MRFILITLTAFVLMEGVSYVAHRYVYHGLLWILHKSHHAPRKGVFELNDLFPLFFSLVAIGLMWYSFGYPERSDILAVTVGVTMYGIIYSTIHDLYVHRRMDLPSLRIPYLQQVKKAHMVHHMTGGEPYGLLVFFTPKHVRDAAPDEPMDATTR
jgi:beta-carotene 3-hydroxylase